MMSAWADVWWPVQSRACISDGLLNVGNLTQEEEVHAMHAFRLLAALLTALHQISSAQQTESSSVVLQHIAILPKVAARDLCTRADGQMSKFCQEALSSVVARHAENGMALHSVSPLLVLTIPQQHALHSFSVDVTITRDSKHSSVDTVNSCFCPEKYFVL